MHISLLSLLFTAVAGTVSSAFEDKTLESRGMS